MTTLNDYEQHLETIAYSEAYSKARSQKIGAVNGGREYSTDYGQDALLRIMPVVKSHIESIYTSVSFHSKPFLCNILKPFTDKKVKGVSGTNLDRVVEMIGVNLVSNISSSPSLHTLTDRMFTSFARLANMDFMVADSMKHDMEEFFLACIADAAKLDIYTINGDGEANYLELSPQWIEYSRNKINTITCDTYAYKPMVVEPIPHQSLISTDGGYLVCKSPLYKYPVYVNGGIHPLLKDFTAEKNAEFFRVMNKIQSTAYAVNTRLLDVINHYYKLGYYFNDFPSNEEQKKSVVEKLVDHEIALRNKRRKDWSDYSGDEYKPLGKMAIRDITRKYDSKNVEEVRKFKDLISQAEYFAQYDNIYYPIFVDFRLRRYTYVQNGLTYQGNELAKSLLHYSEKRKLNKKGLMALFETLANALDFGKESLKMKTPKAIAWWNEHKRTFAVDNDYSIFFDKQDEFDEPITALAIVLELVAYGKDNDHETGIICHRDARCSGASIIGTLLEDAQAMTLTSVLDICKDVAEKLPDAYMAAANNAYTIASESDKKEAQDLVKMKDTFFNRSVFKTPVMTKSAYGLTDYSLRTSNKSLFREEETEHLDGNHKNVFDDLMIKAIDTTLPSCSAYLKTAQKMGAELGKRDGIIAFKSPLNGFPFIMRCNKTVRRKIKTPMGYQHINLVITTPTNKTDVMAMKNGLAPNKIHHVDASLLNYVDGHMDCNLTCIHDSIGSHPNDCHDVVHTYAEAVHWLYHTDFLNKVYEATGFKAKAPKSRTVSNPDAILDSIHILT